MKKGILAIACCSFILSSPLLAFTKYDRIALQGSLLASNGQAYTGFGLVDYGRWFELGMNLAGLNTNNKNTHLFLPSAFAGLRYPMKECAYFAWGVNYASKLGKDSGYHIKSDYSVGPYISLEKWLTYNILLVGYINPYKYGREVVKNSSGGYTKLSSNQYFSSGGIAISYVFDYLHKSMNPTGGIL